MSGERMLSHIVYKLVQVAVVLGFAVLVAGVINRLKGMVQSKRGSNILQPYRDMWKLFHKDQVVSEQSSWIIWFTPYVVFVAPIFVTLLIPILTNYPLFFAFTGDMLAGGLVLALGGFFVTPGGRFLLCTFEVVAVRQVQSCF